MTNTSSRTSRNSGRSRVRAFNATVGIALIAMFTSQCASSVKKPDGLRMTTIAGHGAAELGDSKAATAIVMVHGRSTHKDSWYPMMPKLAAAGYRVVSYDYDSSGDPEIGAVIEQLRKTGASKFVLMGSSLGAGHALRASIDCKIDAIATISFSAVAEVNVPFQPILAVASKNDGETAIHARTIANNQGLRSRALIVDGSTHGVDLVNGNPAVIDAVAQWLTTLPQRRPGPEREPECAP